MKIKIAFIGLFVIELILLFFLFFGDVNFQLLSTKGEIARQQRDLFLIATFIMLLIIGPVFAVTFIIAGRYRESNNKVKRENKIKNNKLLMTLFWLVPTAIIFVIAAMTFKGTHALDPHKPIDSDVKPVRIQVVSLQWRWLFIYPDEGIAAINFIQFPKDTPVNFELTSDAPMNSFWIPSLAGQIYAMTGMSTKLHLVANDVGDYPGNTAEISGTGFSRMNFIARASSYDDYQQWITTTKKSQKDLSFEVYERLSVPSEDSSRVFYSSVEDGLYNKIIGKYMPKMNESNSRKYE